jgi:hypothetical protein
VIPLAKPFHIGSKTAGRRDLLRFLGVGLLGSAGLIGLGFARPARVDAADNTPTPATPVATPTPAITGTPITPTPIAARTPTLQPQPSATPLAPSPAWVQALRTLPLWSGPDDDAEQLGVAARWDYLLIAKPQSGDRLLVLVARTKNYAWVDALAVGPSGPPPPGWPPADLPAPPEDLSVGWVATITDTPLWADAEATLLLGVAPAYTPFKQLDPQDGPRLHVQDPYSGAESWLDASSAGTIDQPRRVDVPGRWWGVSAVDGANLRPRPSTKTLSIGTLPSGHPVVVSGWVAGEEVIKDNPTWAVLSGSTYLYSSVVRPVALPSAPPPPASAARETGRWIDLNLVHQVVVAYEGVTPIRLARTSTGRPGWETAPGRYAIQRRVEKETMESTTLLGLDAQRADYKVENVRWTQYFSADGKALHENYWKPRDEFGIPSSHGCVGLVAEDAHFFWNWADLGVTVVAHY